MERKPGTLQQCTGWLSLGAQKYSLHDGLVSNAGDLAMWNCNECNMCFSFKDRQFSHTKNVHGVGIYDFQMTQHSSANSKMEPELL